MMQFLRNVDEWAHRHAAEFLGATLLLLALFSVFAIAFVATSLIL